MMAYNQSINEDYSFFQIHDVKAKNYLWPPCIQMSKAVSFMSDWSDKDALWNTFEMLYAITENFHHTQSKRLIAGRPANNEIASPFTNIAHNMNFWLPFTGSCNTINEYDNWITKILFHSESCTRSFFYSL